MGGDDFFRLFPVVFLAGVFAFEEGLGIALRTVPLLVGEQHSTTLPNTTGSAYRREKLSPIALQ